MVSGPDQRGGWPNLRVWPVASIVSRRAGRCSDLACGTGIHKTFIKRRSSAVSRDDSWRGRWPGAWT